MRIRNGFLGSALMMLALSGCASLGSVDDLKKETDELKSRLFTVEKELGSTRENMREGIVAVEKNFKSDIAAIRKLSADFQAGVETARSEMRFVTGKLDELSGSVKKNSEDLAGHRDDADKRIMGLEDRLAKLQSAFDALSAKLFEKVAKDAESTPDALYMKALDVFKSGDMAAARETFTRFIEKFPKHDLVANAHYWIGETHYSEKAYEPAVLSFQEVIGKYPQKDKVPAAMLKQGMAFKAINDAKSARYVLKKLAEGYPKNEEAKKAKELLKEIK